MAFRILPFAFASSYDTHTTQQYIAGGGGKKMIGDEHEDTHRLWEMPVSIIRSAKTTRWFNKHTTSPVAAAGEWVP